MKIGVVGSGKVGKALGAWAAKVGFAVAFASRKESDAQDAARNAGYCTQAMDVAALVRECDMLLLTLPYKEIEGVLAPLQKDLAGKTLVDVSNPITEDRRALTIGHTTSGAETIAAQFPMANVVKAFNAVFAEVYALQHPQIDGRAISIFYAGDNLDAKEGVWELITRLGFDAVDAGPLETARYLEPLSLLNIHLGRELGFGPRIGFALLRN